MADAKESSQKHPWSTYILRYKYKDNQEITHKDGIFASSHKISRFSHTEPYPHLASTSFFQMTTVSLGRGRRGRAGAFQLATGLTIPCCLGWKLRIHSNVSP